MWKMNWEQCERSSNGLIGGIIQANGWSHWEKHEYHHSGSVTSKNKANPLSTKFKAEVLIAVPWHPEDKFVKCTGRGKIASLPKYQFHDCLEKTVWYGYIHP